MNGVEFIDPAVITWTIEESYDVPSQVKALTVKPLYPELDQLFEILEPRRFAGISPPQEPPTDACFGYDTCSICIDKAIQVIDDHGLDGEEMFALLYKLEHLNTLSREVAHRRDSILHG